MGVYEAADGRIVIGASGQAQYHKFCTAIGAPELAADARFAAPEARLANRAAFTAEVNARTRAAPSAVWVERLNAAGVACGPINTLDRTFADPQVRSLGIVQTVGHPRLGALDLLGSAVRMSAAAAAIDRPAPDKGAHTEAVLREFGFSDAEIARLRADRVAI